MIGRKMMVMLDESEIERLYGNQEVDTRTREEKISDYASTRERDGQGRFLSKKEKERQELEAYYYSPYKIVYKPKRNGPDHVLVRQEELYWYQKAHVIAGIGLGFVGIYTLLIMVYEGAKALLFG